MSRIGNIPITVVDGVDVTIDGDTIKVKGPLGELSQEMTGGIQAAVEDGKLTLTRPDDEPRSKSLHGLYRSLANGMVEGVTKGFMKRLEVVGVSYQAAVEGNRLRLQVGFSHPVFVDIPTGLKVVCPSPTVIEGFHKIIDQYVGTQVTHLLLNTNYQRAAYPSEVWETYWDVPDPERDTSGWPRLTWLVHETGVDLYQVCIDRCREKGVSPWVSVRMNDTHYCDEQAKMSSTSGCDRRRSCR